MSTITCTEIDRDEFFEFHDHQPEHRWCEANLVHDPEGASVGFVERDHEERVGSGFFFEGAWRLTNRHGQAIWACEDCVGAIEDHQERLGEPDEGLATVRFELVDQSPIQANCDANIQHNLSQGQGGEFSVDYGHIRPRLKRVCGACLESVLADLRVMGWPTAVEHTVEAIMGADR